MYDWRVDLDFGEQFEQRVIKLLKGKYDLVKQEGYFPAYDLLCERTGFKIECKSDRKMHESGNIIVEKLALDKCEADLFLYENNHTGEIHYAEWPELKYWVSLAVGIGDYVERGVGENNTLGYIVPLEHTIAYMNKWNTGRVS
jgi:hypothetical protein